MRLAVEYLTPDSLIVCEFPKVLATIKLYNLDVLVAPRVSSRSFLVMCPPGEPSITARPGQAYELRVDGQLQACVHLRSNDVSICFQPDVDMFVIQII